MMDIPLKDVPLLDSFVRGDDAFRNSRFKLIPYISKVCPCVCGLTNSQAFRYGILYSAYIM